MSTAPMPNGDRIVLDAATGQWFVFGYDDVVAGLSDPRLTNDRMHRFAERAPAEALAVVRRHVPSLISPDGSDYAWLRPVLHAGLRQAVGRDAEGALEAAAHELLDVLLARPSFDAVGEYAFALSGVALADFLGVDRADAGDLMRWAVDIVAFFNEVQITSHAAAAMASSAAEMTAYARELLAAGPAAPAAGFLAVAARAAADGGHALDDEAIGNLALPFLTGQVAVAQLVANSVWLLLAHDGERARLAADPNLLAGALGETLRYMPPASLAPRIALVPLALGGRAIAPGQTVQLSLAAANRDPERFPDPDRFDIGRRQSGALGFGHGAHSCIGAGLARMQSAIALRVLLERAPDLELDPAHEVEWSPLAGVEGPDAMRVRVRAARAARRARSPAAGS